MFVEQYWCEDMWLDGKDMLLLFGHLVTVSLSCIWEEGAAGL